MGWMDGWMGLDVTVRRVHIHVRMRAHGWTHRACNAGPRLGTYPGGSCCPCRFSGGQVGVGFWVTGGRWTVKG